MSINAIGGSSFNFGAPFDPIKPETRQKLRELGIDEKSVRTETQAQNKIHAKEEQIKKAVQQRMQEEASTQVQTAQASSQSIQPQQVQSVDKTDKVDGLNQLQQVQKPQGLEQQHALNNQRQGDEQIKAFAGSQSAQAPKEAQQAQPFDNEKDLLAMYKKLQLGLI